MDGLRTSCTDPSRAQSVDSAKTAALTAMSFDHAVPPADACFRLAMAASGIGMAIVDLGGRWREVNPAIERMLGHDSAALVGHATAEFIHPEAIPQAQAQRPELRAGPLALID